jgi:hypothetical protein
MKVAKPPSRAWIVSQRAGRSLSLRSEWATPGRHSHESAGGDRDRLGLAPDLEGQFALEDVEGIRVLVVDVRGCYLFARCVRDDHLRAQG